MGTLQRTCAGLDVHKDTVVACVRWLDVSIGQEAGHNIGQDRGRERLPDEGDLQLPRMCDDWS